MMKLLGIPVKFVDDMPANEVRITFKENWLNQCRRDITIENVRFEDGNPWLFCPKCFELRENLRYNIKIIENKMKSGEMK